MGGSSHLWEGLWQDTGFCALANTIWTSWLATEVWYSLAQKSVLRTLTGREFAPAVARATGYYCLRCCNMPLITCSNCKVKLQRHRSRNTRNNCTFKPFTLNKCEVMPQLYLQGCPLCFHIVLPHELHAFDSEETNKTKYRLYCLGILKQVHTTSKNSTVLQAAGFSHEA